MVIPVNISLFVERESPVSIARRKQDWRQETCIGTLVIMLPSSADDAIVRSKEIGFPISVFLSFLCLVNFWSFNCFEMIRFHISILCFFLNKIFFSTLGRLNWIKGSWWNEYRKDREPNPGPPLVTWCS